jgi:hypothetical protein
VVIAVLLVVVVPASPTTTNSTAICCIWLVDSVESTSYVSLQSGPFVPTNNFLTYE